MQIMIDIDAMAYKFVQNTSFVEDESIIFKQTNADRQKTLFLFNILDAIKNGTPLPNRWNKYDDNDPTTWPEDGSWGLWQHKSGKMNVLRWKQDALNHFYPDPYMWDIDDAVAWMPLPEPYKAESEE